MAYDADRQPAEWTRRRANRHERGFFGYLALIGFAVVLLIGAALVHAPIWLVVVVLAAVGIIAVATNTQLELFGRWHGGVAAEEAVGAELKRLRPRFVVMHDIEHRKRGNIDHIVAGPSGVFVIETKQNAYLDEHLPKVKRQAAEIHDDLGVWVTPVICLARRQRRPFRHKGVWIVCRRDIVEWIAAQRGTPVPFERLARFADTL